MMSTKRNVLLFIPIIAIILLVISVAFSAAIQQGKGFNVGSFFLNEKPEFSLAFCIALIEYIGIVIANYLENRPTIAGVWNVLVSPNNWRGETNPGVRGKGTMYVAKSMHGENEYNGLIHLKYNDHANNPLLEGTYEIHLTAKGNKVTGKSNILWGKGLTEGYLDEKDPDKGFTNRCDYDLTIESAGKISGTAKMVIGPSTGEFEATRT